MGKKKNSDFSKIKVKIGKSKPSNNVTKFNIKTGKVVIPGDNNFTNKKLKIINETFLSAEKVDIIANLKKIDLILIEYLCKKRAVIQGQPLDLTQPLWPTYYRREGWVTPWDCVVAECVESMGEAGLWFPVVVLQSAAGRKEEAVQAAVVRTVGLYLELAGDTRGDCGGVLRLLRSYMEAGGGRGRKQLGTELLYLLAVHSPGALWYHSRRRAAIYCLQTVAALYKETLKLHEPFINEYKFIMLAASVIYSVLDGRKATSIIIGEDWSQIDDIENPPFSSDLLYEDCEERVNFAIMEVTDSKDDTWDESTLNRQSSFNLETYLTNFTDNILDIAQNMAPLDLSCEKTLEKIIKITEILNRACLRSQSSKKWSSFIEVLTAEFPYTYVEEKEEKMEVDDDDDLEKKNDVIEKLSKKDKKLRKQKLELAAKMKELCRQATTVKDVKAVHKLNDSLNYYTVALVHQCLVSEKISATDNTFYSDWLLRLKNYVSSSIDRTDNKVLYKWLILSKQMLHLTFDKSCHAALPLCNIFVELSYDLFLTSHSLSKVKRLSLAVFVESCHIFSTLDSLVSALPLFNIEDRFMNCLVDQILADHTEGNMGLQSPHPTFVSTSQTHFDITLPKALYRLLLIDYPEVANMIAEMEVGKRSMLKTILNNLRLEIKKSEYPPPQVSWNIFRKEHLNQIPKKYLWDYFTFDNVSRKDGVQERMKPLSSSVAQFMLK